jgi:hypothetical protein
VWHRISKTGLLLIILIEARSLVGDCYSGDKCNARKKKVSEVSSIAKLKECDEKKRECSMRE